MESGLKYIALADTDPVPHIDGQDAVGDLREVYPWSMKEPLKPLRREYKSICIRKHIKHSLSSHTHLMDSKIGEVLYIRGLLKASPQLACHIPNKYTDIHSPPTFCTPNFPSLNSCDIL